MLLYKLVAFIGQHLVLSFTDSSIYELSQPSDLLVHFPMWSVSQPLGNTDGGCELGQVQYEVEVPTDGSLTSYPHSPGSTGDHSDYSSGDLSLYLSNNYMFIQLQIVTYRLGKIKHQVYLYIK